MRAAKNSLAVIISVIAVTGLLFSQLCSLKCDVADCGPARPAVATGHTAQPNQCHKEAEPEKSEREKPAPAPHRGSDDCNTHGDTAALMPSTATAFLSPHLETQPIFAEPASVFRPFLGDLTAVYRVNIPDRSPPRKTSSVLRI
jgi:hypothetical protein